MDDFFADILHKIHLTISHINSWEWTEKSSVTPSPHAESLIKAPPLQRDQMQQCIPPLISPLAVEWNLILAHFIS